MPARVSTVAFEGFDVRRIEAEAIFTGGKQAFSVVGMGDKAVAESRERVRGCFAGLGLSLPGKRIVVNLSPADLPKEGTHFDLPIALALMVEMGIIPHDALDRYICIGELRLDGQIAGVLGALPAAIAASSYDMGLICPADNGAEAAWAGDMPILAPRSLVALINHFKGHSALSRPEPGAVVDTPRKLDLREVKGQEGPKRALEIAAAGGHNLFIVWLIKLWDKRECLLPPLRELKPIATFECPRPNRPRGIRYGDKKRLRKNMPPSTILKSSISSTTSAFPPSINRMPNSGSFPSSCTRQRLG